jgi:PAS domain S-box-containing protein
VNSIDLVEQKFLKSKKKDKRTPLKCSKQTLNKYKNPKSLFKEPELNLQQFKIASNDLPVGLALYKIIYDEKGVAIDFIPLEVNRAYEEIFGVKKEQIIWKKAAQYYPEIKKEAVDWIGIFGKVAATRVPECFQAHCASKEKYFQVYIYSPKKGYCVSLFIDTTKQINNGSNRLEQKKEEQKLANAEKRYRILFRTTQDGIMVRDIQGRTIDCNKAYAKMLGYTKKELKQLSVQQLIPEKWYDQREKIVNEVLRSGRFILFEREYKRKDGSIFPASVRTWRLTDGKGKAIGIWSIVRDITEQKELQKDLEEHTGILEKIIDERTKQLKDSERLATIGQTAGMVGHDLRNPLQTITGELYLAKDEVESLADGEAKNNLRESMQVIEEQAVYMDKIVSDLQAFVRPVKIDKKPVVLKEIVAAVLETVAIPKDMTVKMQIRDDFPEIKCDDQLIKRVLINLVTNAVQAMPSGGILTLSAQVISGDQVSLAVEDTGVGIPEHIKPQIFTPLFTTKPRGQGFGLAVCKRVIEAHDGTISFESSAGKGATFTIQFPVG